MIALMNCKNCNKNGITLLNVIAYSSDANISCKFCGKIFGITKLGSFMYRFLEGTLILFSIMYSFYILSAWPLVLSIVISLLVRTFILPKFAHQIETKPSWRIKKEK